MDARPLPPRAHVVCLLSLSVGYFLSDHGDGEVRAEGEADEGSVGGAERRERREMEAARVSLTVRRK